MPDIKYAIIAGVIVVVSMLVIWWFLAISGLTGPEGFVYAQY